MINKNEAKIEAWKAISDLFGNEYFRTHFEDSCESYPTDDDDDINFEYFMGFEADSSTHLWTVFARINVNRDTGVATFLDYKTPKGLRMDNPPKPVRLA